MFSTSFWKNYLEKPIIVMEELRKRKLDEIYDFVVFKFSDDFVLDKMTREMFIKELDCYLFYSKISLFRKLFHYACNNENLESFSQFLSLMQKKNGGRTCCFAPPLECNITKLYLWARIITLNELVCNDNLSITIRSEYEPEIQEKIQMYYFSILNFLFPNVLNQIIIDYAKDFIFTLNCLLSQEIVNTEIKLIYPTWDSISKC